MRFFESETVQIPVGTFGLRLDRLGRFDLVHTSLAFAKILEMSTDKLPTLSQLVCMYIHPEDHGDFSETLRKAAMSLQPVTWEGRLTVGGEAKTTRIELSPPASGNLQKIWTGTLQDLTDVKNLQAEFASVLDAAQAYTWRRDVRLHQSQFGQRWAKFAHHDGGRNSMPNEEWLALVHPDDAHRVQAQVEALERGEAEHQVLLYRRKLAEGSWAWLRVHAGISEKDEAGTPLALSGVSFDITAEMKKQQRFELANQKLRDDLFDAQTALERTAYEITENIPVGTYTMILSPGDDIAKFGFMSRKFFEITGLEEEEARADPLRAFACVHPEDHGEWVQKNAHAFVHKLPFRGEARLVVNGQVRWILAESVPRPKQDGTWVWEGVIQDITAQKISEEALRRSNQNFLQIASAKARLSEREALLKDIHDGFGNQLAIGKLRLSRGAVSAEKAVEIIDDCLDDLRLLFESLDAEGESFWSLLVGLRDRMNFRTQSLPVTLDWHIDAARRIMLSASEMLQAARIVQEALANALRHANARAISVTVCVDKDRPYIEVRDDGKGIDPHQTSTGRGLSNMRARAEQKNWHLEIDSCSEGTCVTLSLGEV